MVNSQAQARPFNQIVTFSGLNDPTITQTVEPRSRPAGARIVVALADAGFHIVSANGDTRCLARDPATGTAFVRH